MRTKEDQRQFILDTLLVYKNDLSKRAVDLSGGCVYLTKDGRKCAVGQHLKPGKWQKFQGEYIDLINTYDKKTILTDEALSMGFNKEVWSRMQEYHDNIECSHTGSIRNIGSIRIVEEIERLLNIELSELKF